jgi:hypothetical protein
MVKKLFAIAALVCGVGVAASAPAPAIDFICSCKLCTTSTSNLACRDFEHGGLTTTSCGDYHVKYCP